MADERLLVREAALRVLRHQREGRVMSRSADAGEDAPRIVEEGVVELFDTAETVLGDRIAERRRDPDRGARITVVDLNDDDVEVLQNTAARLGIAEWTRIERADPAATVAIPLLVGTASFTPDLGYTIPAGTWQLTAPMDLEDRRLVTPPMEFTVAP